MWYLLLYWPPTAVLDDEAVMEKMLDYVMEFIFVEVVNGL